jgi:hypothetical protein
MIAAAIAPVSTTHSASTAHRANPTNTAKVAAIAAARDWIRGPVAAIDVRVPVEIVVFIDGDVVVAAAPSAPQPQPPLQNAPIITPMPKEIAMSAA